MTRVTALIIALVAIATGAWLYWDSLDTPPAAPAEAPSAPAE
ncbi:MAG: hypothetical protein V2I65_06825 [Paracoccaceae bacterium]|jgi:hypothetical protein|nr:hypothetical protein [Paracoccaceae bacterium]